MITRLKSTFRFSSAEEYNKYLEEQHGDLPKGFSVGTTSFKFVPEEAPHLPATMTLTLIKPDEPTSLFGAVFTRNAFPGAPVKVGKRILEHEKLGAIIVNNKISNVCAKGGGVDDCLKVCGAIAKMMKFDPNTAVFPSSTGVIGWRIPVDSIINNIQGAINNLQSDSILPAARGIMTTDLYPKVRSRTLKGGRIVGIAKGAGMIEPNMATMLSYILTDVAVPRAKLRAILSSVIEETFNCISVDTDESTSDTVAIVSSGKVPYSDADEAAFRDALFEVCHGLAEDVARNGEGAQHLLRVKVTGAPSKSHARGIGKAIINSPLFKCAVAGNDPNVGRLVMAVGKYIGKEIPQISTSMCRMKMGNVPIFDKGEFLLNSQVEKELVSHMKQAQLIDPTKEGRSSSNESHDFPPHDKAVEVEVDLGAGDAQVTVTGIDLTHGYVEINADYRS